MRKCAIVLLLWGIAFPAMAAKIMSIDQMEQFLIKLHGKPDGKVAGELEDARLTERVSQARLARWEADFTGKRTQEELMKLADTSAFLNPPASDVLRDPPPDEDTQRQMLEHAVEYIKTTMTRLPNFYVTRETTHFEETLSQHATSSMAPAAMGTRSGGMPVQTSGVSTATEVKALHSTGETRTTVTYRDGHEVRDTGMAKDEMEDQPALGLTTSGEFGPILDVVMGDVVQSQVTWLRWEPSVSEPAGVFRYVVPQDHSDYAVRIPNGAKTIELHPGYHGEIAIDPATGEILRISAAADLPQPFETMQTAILVEYGAVTIGDRTYICPTHGVAYSKVPVAGAVAEPQGSTVTVQTQLNDVAFTQYHLSSAEAHIVSGGSGPEGVTPPAPDAAAEPAVTQPVSHP
jgi:hypothetical protein